MESWKLKCEYNQMYLFMCLIVICKWILCSFFYTGIACYVISKFWDEVFMPDMWTESNIRPYLVLVWNLFLEIFLEVLFWLNQFVSLSDLWKIKSESSVCVVKSIKEFKGSFHISLMQVETFWNHGGPVYSIWMIVNIVKKPVINYL